MTGTRWPDRAAAERLLDGEDADTSLGRVLAHARGPAGPHELLGEHAAAAMFRAGGGAPVPLRSRRTLSRVLTVKVAVVGALLAGSGLAVASVTGTLPMPVRGRRGPRRRCRQAASDHRCPRPAGARRRARRARHSRTVGGRQPTGPDERPERARAVAASARQQRASHSRKEERRHPAPSRGQGQVSADVFVDRTGRRRRVLAWLAVAAAAVLVGALGLLAAGLLAGGPLPLQGWTGPGRTRP